MMKSVCLGLVMVLLLVQLNARHHHHHMNHRHHSEHSHHHDHNLAQTSLSILESNGFFEGYWKEITGNSNTKDFNKACEALNQKAGASKLLDFNSKLAKIHDAWGLTSFAPIWNEWGKKFHATARGEEVHAALHSLFKLTQEFWSIIFAPYTKRSDAHAGIVECAKRKNLAKLPVFDKVFGPAKDWPASFKKLSASFGHNSGKLVGKLVLEMAHNGGKPFCEAPKKVDKKEAVKQKEAGIDKKKELIKKEEARIAKLKAEIKKDEKVIQKTKVEIKKDEKKAVEIKKNKKELERKEASFLKEKAKIISKEAEFKGTPEAKAKAEKARAAALKAATHGNKPSSESKHSDKAKVHPNFNAKTQKNWN